MWICKIIGHKHVRHGLGWSQFNLSYCLRCHAASATEQGDGALLCKALGHKSRKILIGDYSDQDVTLNACFRCHAKA